MTEVRTLFGEIFDMIATMTHIARLRRSSKEHVPIRDTDAGRISLESGRLVGRVNASTPGYRAVVSLTRTSPRGFKVFATIPGHHVRLTTTMPTKTGRVGVTLQSSGARGDVKEVMNAWIAGANAHMAAAMRRAAQGVQYTSTVKLNRDPFSNYDRRILTGALVDATTAKTWGPVIDSVPWYAVHAHGSCGRTHFRLNAGQFVVYVINPGSWAVSSDVLPLVFEDPTRTETLVHGKPVTLMDVTVFPRLYGPGDSVQDTELSFTDSRANFGASFGVYRIPFQQRGFDMDFHRPDKPPLANRILQAAHQKEPHPLGMNKYHTLRTTARLSELIKKMGQGVFVLYSCRVLDFFPYRSLPSNPKEAYTRRNALDVSALRKYVGGTIQRNVLDAMPQAQDMRFLRQRDVEAAMRFHSDAGKQLELRDDLYAGPGLGLSGIEGGKKDRRRSMPRRGRVPIPKSVDQGKLYTEILRVIDTIGPDVLRALLKHVTDRETMHALVTGRGLSNKSLRKAAPAFKRRARQLGMRQHRSGAWA